MLNGSFFCRFSHQAVAHAQAVTWLKKSNTTHWSLKFCPLTRVPGGQGRGEGLYGLINTMADPLWSIVPNRPANKQQQRAAAPHLRETQDTMAPKKVRPRSPQREAVTVNYTCIDLKIPWQSYPFVCHAQQYNIKIVEIKEVGCDQRKLVTYLTSEIRLQILSTLLISVTYFICVYETAPPGREIGAQRRDATLPLECLRKARAWRCTFMSGDNAVHLESI